MTRVSLQSLACSPGNVLQLIDVGGPGGAQQVFVDLSSQLDSVQWRVTAAVPASGWLHDQLKSNGVDTVIIPISRGPFDWRYLANLARVVRRRKIDLIHAHLLGPTLYASIVGLLLRVPVVATFHGQVDISPGERFRRTKFAIINSACRRVIFVSDALRRFFLTSTPLRADIAEVIHNGIDFGSADTAAARSLRNELGIDSDALLIGAVGNVRPPKAYDVLLRVAARLATVSPRYRFVVVGAADDTALDARLKQTRDEMGLQDVVHFIGFRSDVPGLMKQFDAYLMTSSLEGLSLSTIQALAAGVPTVATRCGGPEEIIAHERTGLLAEVGDDQALADAIRQLTADPARAAAVAAAGSRDVRARFGMGRMVAAHERLYGEVVADTHSGSHSPAATRLPSVSRS